MRKLILSMKISIDGFATGLNDDMSWLQKDGDQHWNDLFKMLENVDLFIMGGGMWNGYKDYWKSALKEKGFSKNEIKYAKLAERTQHLIFSSTLKNAGWENAAIESGDVKQVIKLIKKQPGKDIQIVGGPEFASSIIDSGLIDEYRLMINPVILGKGKSIFENLQFQHHLKRTKIKAFDNGVTVITYTQLDTKKIKPKL